LKKNCCKFSQILKDKNLGEIILDRVALKNCWLTTIFATTTTTTKYGRKIAFRYLWLTRWSKCRSRNSIAFFSSKENVKKVLDIQDLHACSIHVRAFLSSLFVDVSGTNTSLYMDGFKDENQRFRVAKKMTKNIIGSYTIFVSANLYSALEWFYPRQSKWKITKWRNIPKNLGFTSQWNITVTMVVSN
jgi:hypothetical protein